MRELNNFFIVRFNPVAPESTKFIADKNGNMPLIGEVFAGKYYSSIVNGTRAQREGIVAGKLYLCTNTAVEVADPATGELREMFNTTVVSEVSAIELIKLKADLGATVRIESKPATENFEEDTPAEEPASKSKSSKTEDMFN